jgi:hypothetical protein
LYFEASTGTAFPGHAPQSQAPFDSRRLKELGGELKSIDIRVIMPSGRWMRTFRFSGLRIGFTDTVNLFHPRQSAKWLESSGLERALPMPPQVKPSKLHFDLPNLCARGLAQGLPVQDSYGELSIWLLRKIALGANWSKKYENLVQKV